MSPFWREALFRIFESLIPSWPLALLACIFLKTVLKIISFLIYLKFKSPVAASKSLSFKEYFQVLPKLGHLVDIVVSLISG
jgi:hypothetical protein